MLHAVGLHDSIIRIWKKTMDMTRSKIARNLAFNKVKKFTSNLMIFENRFCKYVTSWLQNKKNLCKIYYDKLNIDNFIFFMQIINFFYFERNFQYLQCSDLDKILHGGSLWCWVPYFSLCLTDFFLLVIFLLSSHWLIRVFNDSCIR